jgi:glycolate oxidase FAD binding subunit
VSVELRAAAERSLGIEVAEQELPGGGAVPRLDPVDEGQLAEVLHWARREGLRVLPSGLGSRLGDASVTAPDVVVSVRHLRGIVAHEVADGTLTARAGTTLTELAAATQAQSQEFAPRLERSATLGGALSSGLAGLDRLRRGPARDHVLGARLMLADGRVATSGGRLVKNVTGYDLHRLWCGARGSCGVLLEATLRLFPAPPAAARFTAPVEALEQAVERCLQCARGTAPPRRVELREGPDGSWRLWAELADGEAALAETLAALRVGFPDGSTEPFAPAQLWDLPLAPAPQPSFTVSTRPSRGLAAVSALARARATTGLAATLTLAPCLAEARAELPRDAAADALAAFAAELARGLPAGARLRGSDLPAAAAHTLRDALPAEPSAAALVARLHTALDPERRFGP